MGIRATYEMLTLLTLLRASYMVQGRSHLLHLKARGSYRQIWMGINSSTHSVLPRGAPTEDLVLSGQQIDPNYCCHGPELVYTDQGDNELMLSQFSFPFQG